MHEPVTANPVDFRFEGRDGRGNVNLIRDPMSGRGIAVLRVDDPKGGAEAYAFDLLWRGGSDYNNSGQGYGRDRDSTAGLCAVTTIAMTATPARPRTL